MNRLSPTSVSASTYRGDPVWGLKRSPRRCRGLLNVRGWRLGDLDGKPEGLAFAAEGHAIIGLDTRKPRRNLVLLESAIAPLRRASKA